MPPMHTLNYGQARAQLGPANADRMWRSLPSRQTRAELTAHEYSVLSFLSPDSPIARFNRHAVVQRAHGRPIDYGVLTRKAPV